MKAIDDMVVMEVGAESTIGVRTRAKTLALQRLKSSTFSPNATNSASNASDDASCYLQLRSRRLHKVSPLKPQKNSSHHITCSEACPPSPISSLGVSVFDAEPEYDGVLGVEASFGENNLDSETRGRVTRESTPCSMIRDVDVVAPGSSTRQTSSIAANYRNQNGFLRDIPSTYEMEEFFDRAEQQQQRQFLDKYNFDVFTDSPLSGGRYDWVRV